MIEIKLGTRYAKSLYTLAEEKNLLQEVKNDFTLIQSVCKSNPDFVVMLKSPLVYADKKQKVIELIFGNKINSMTLELIRIMIRKGREPFLRDVAECFLSLYDQRNKITRGVLVTAEPISEAQFNAICKKVETALGTTFILEKNTDPNLIGGFVLEVGDRLFDGSISGKLRKLRHEFDKNLYIQKV